MSYNRLITEGHTLSFPYVVAIRCLTGQIVVTDQEDTFVVPAGKEQELHPVGDISVHALQQSNVELIEESERPAKKTRKKKS